MDVLFALLFILSLVAIVVGILIPKLVIRWGENRTRRNVLKTYGLTMVVSFILLLVFIESPSDGPQESISPQDSQLKQVSSNLLQPDRPGPPATTASKSADDEAVEISGGDASEQDAKLAAMEGDWCLVTTNPVHQGKVAADYISYYFEPNGIVRKRKQSGGEIEVDEGKYSFNSERNTIDGRFDLGDSGVQIFSWRKESPDVSRIVYWENQNLGIEREDDELFVKRNSPEWDRRGQVWLNEKSSVSFTDPNTLEVGKTYRLIKKIRLMPQLEDPDSLEELKSTLSSVRDLNPGDTFKILSRKQKGSTPWFHVEAKRDGTSGAHRGWINGTALLGESLEPIR